MINIGIFSGSKTPLFFNNITLELKKIAERLDIQKYSLVYGGGSSGLMGVIPKKYSELGGKVIGVDADMFVKRFGKADFGEHIVYDTFNERQMRLIQKSHIVLVLPGGVGTVSELFDVLTLNDLNLRDIHVLVYNYNGFYDEIIQFIHKRQLDGFIKHLKNVYYLKSAEEILNTIKTIN
jgi:uncharacterized protein (TIGR00730 family)